LFNRLREGGVEELVRAIAACCFLTRWPYVYLPLQIQPVFEQYKRKEAKLTLSAKLANSDLVCQLQIADSQALSEVVARVTHSTVGSE
jgi:hypothetical protein